MSRESGIASVMNCGCGSLLPYHLMRCYVEEKYEIGEREREWLTVEIFARDYFTPLRYLNLIASLSSHLLLCFVCDAPSFLIANTTTRSDYVESLQRRSCGRTGSKSPPSRPSHRHSSLRVVILQQSLLMLNSARSNAEVEFNAHIQVNRTPIQLRGLFNSLQLIRSGSNRTGHRGFSGSQCSLLSDQ